MRFLLFVLGTLFVLGIGRVAWATCMIVSCDESITRPDGSAFPEDEQRRVRLAAYEPFVHRLECETSCGVAGGSGPRRGTLSPLDVGSSSVDRIGRPCGGAPLAYEATTDPFAFSVPSGLPPGHYRVGYTNVVVGDVPDAGECPPPPPPPPGEGFVPPPVEPVSPSSSWAEDWDDRSGATWELGAGPWFGAWAAEGRGGAEGTGFDPALGAVVVFGVHGMIPRSSGSDDDWLPEYEAFRFCAFATCGLIGMLFAPTGTLVGNELGLELRGAAAGSTAGQGALVRGSVRPFLRYSSGSLRTQTMAGMIAPEVGVQWHERRGTALVLSWSVFPIDWRFAGPLALAFDPFRGSIFFPESGEGGGEIGAEITLRFAL